MTETHPFLFKLKDCLSVVEEENEHIEAKNLILADFERHFEKAQERMKVQAI